MKTFFTCLLCLVSAYVFADTCPSVHDIKTGALNGWKIFDSEEGTPLPPRRKAMFKKQIEQFVLAEWPENSKKHSVIHCYYRDHDGSNLEAYLSKSNYVPKQLPYWYKVTGNLDCAASQTKCQFVSFKRTQLAAR